MRKSTIAAIDRKLAKEQQAVGKTRDHLDEVISELSSLMESCDRAYDHLQDARDALSELA